MTDREELEIAVKALDSRKAKNITALKVEDLTILANYFIIASATSTTQVKALADEVEYQLGEKGVRATRARPGSCLITTTSSCMCSWRKPGISISWSASGRTAHRWIFPTSSRAECVVKRQISTSGFVRNHENQKSRINLGLSLDKSWFLRYN